MKKILAMVMIAGLMFSSTIGLCFGYDAGTASADVKVTAILDAAFDISEKLTIHGVINEQNVDVSDLWVTNLTANKTIKVESVKAEASGSKNWVLSSLSDVNGAARDSKYLYLYMENTDLRTGCVPSSGEITGLNTSKNFSIGGNIPEQTTSMNSAEVAKLIVTLSVTDTDGSGDGGAGDDGGMNILYNSDGSYNIDYLKTVTWSNGTNEEVAAVIAAIDAGELDPTTDLDITSTDGWGVGAERTFTLKFIDTKAYSFTDTDGRVYEGYVNDTDDAQTVTWVIMDTPGSAACKTKKWIDESGNTHEASFIIGMEEPLQEQGYMNGSATNTGSWKACQRRAWCNTIFYSVMLRTMGLNEDGSDNFFKKVSNATADLDLNDIVITYDYFALPGTVEYLGKGNSHGLSVERTSDELARFSWFAAGNSNAGWKRTPLTNTYKDTTYYTFCSAYGGYNGEASASVYCSANSNMYITPFGCL